MKKIFATNPENITALIARLALGVAVFPHGAQKLLGWFGGYGFAGSMGYFTGTVGAPWLVGLLVILGEFFGPILLILGFGTRFAAASLAIIMLGAAWQLRANGFFMNWFGNQKGEGIELFILVIGIAISLVISGGGKWSVDSAVNH